MKNFTKVDLGRLLFSLSILFIVWPSFTKAQVTVTDGFEATTSFTVSSATYLFTTGAGSNPTETAHGGSTQVEYNSYSAASGNTATLFSPVVDWSGRGASTPTISFWVYRYGNASSTYTGADSLGVYVNTSASLTAATFLGKIPRRIDQATVAGTGITLTGTSSPSSAGWYQYSVTVPSGFNTATNYFMLKFTSKNGYNIFVDDFSWVTYPCTAPTITTQPSSGSQSLCTGATATALTVATSASSPAYQWYSNTTSSNTGGASITSATSASYTPPTTAAGTTYYYCKVTASSCTTTSSVSGAITVTAALTGVASAPSPSTGATGTCYSGTGAVTSVSWTAPSGTVSSYDVYFGAGSLPGTVTANVTTTSYTCGTLLPNTTYYWKVVPGNTVCGNTSGSPVTWTFTTASAPCYCTPSGGTSDGISGVIFNTISNTGTGLNGYTNYTATQSTTVTVGSAYNLSVYVNTGGNYTNSQKAWIDWNGDGTFNTTAGSAGGLGEEYTLGTATNVTNGLSSLCPLSITVPTGATTGSVRMRISSKYSGYTTSCATGIDGEFEDYTVVIAAPLTPCTSPTVAPTALTATSSATTLSGSFTPPSTLPTGGYLVLYSTASTMSAQPVAGTSYTIGNTIGGATVIGVNPVGTNTFSYSTGISANTQYYVFVIPYNKQSGTCSEGYAATGSQLTGSNNTCPAAPTALSVNNSSITASSATVSWTAPSGGSLPITYTVQYRVNGSGTWITASTNAASPYTLSGLTANTTYDVQIFATNASCSGTAVSTNSLFFTLCSAIAVNPAFLETFDATSTTVNCWTITEDVSGASYHWSTATADATHGAAGPQASTRFAFLDVYDASDLYNSYYLNSPLFVLDATPKNLTYYYHLGSAGYQGTAPTSTDPYPLIVQINVNGTGWNDLYSHSAANSTFSTGSSGWYQNVIDLSCYAGQSIQIRYKANSNYGSGYCNIGLDQVSIADQTTCPAPTGLAANPGTTSATVSWTASCAASSYDLYYSTSATAPGTGTTPSYSGVATNYKTILGLSTTTTYYVWVRSNCGSGSLSDWTALPSFTTLAKSAIIGIPIAYYDFENNTTRTTFENQVEQEINTGGGSAMSVSSGVTSTNANGAGLFSTYGVANGKAFAWYPGATTTTDPGTAATRYFQFKVSTAGFKNLQLTFDVYPNNVNSPYYGVLYSTDGTNWNFVSSVDNPGTNDDVPWNSGAWNYAYINLPAGCNNQANLYFRIYGYYALGTGSNANTRWDNITVLAQSTVPGKVFTTLDGTAIYTSTTSGATGYQFIDYNFTADGVGTVMSIYNNLALDEDFIVSNNATINFYIGTTPSYYTDLGGGNLTVNAGCTLNITDPDGITSVGTYDGNVQNSGTRSFSPGATYNYTGFATQTTGNGLPANLTGTGSLGINNSNGVTLTQSTTVSGTGALTFSNGKLTTGSNTMAIGTSASLTGYGSSKYVIGNLRRYINSSGAYDYPVGDASHYELGNLNFHSQAGIGSVLGYYTTGQSGTAPVSTTCVINHSSINDYLNNGFWTFTPDAPISSGNYDVTLNATGYTNGPTDAGRIGVIKRANASSPWLGCGNDLNGNPQSSTLGTHTYGTQSISGGVATAERTGVGAFSDFAIGIGASNTPLPVTLLYLTATAVDNSYLRLDWATASEINNSGFEIQRSTDGISYETIGWVDGHGNSNTKIDYSYDDKTVIPNSIYYYRMRQLDFDGKDDYSNIVSGTIIGKNGFVVESLRPNPASSKVTVQVASSAGQSATVSLADALGRELQTREWEIYEGFNGIDLDLTPYAAGTYTIVVRSQNSYFTRKLVINR
ncbi:MAG: fibronectin type III domain-containing protein [Bacteroidetes bacterium]|nr:fibronectin type III domain-containing protein [Bacteroidota bacterium]